MRLSQHFTAQLALLLALLCILSLTVPLRAEAAGIGQIDRLTINFTVPPIVCGEVAALKAGTATPGCRITGMVWYDMYGQPMEGYFTYDNATVVLTVDTAPSYYFSGALQVDIDGQYAPFENYGSRLVISRSFSPVIWAPNIVKHPTSETILPGALASFVSYASFTNESQWTIIDTAGKHYSVESIAEKFPGVTFYAEYTKLNIAPVPKEMDGYKVRCTFTGPGGSVSSGYAEIIVATPEELAQAAGLPAPAAPAHEHSFSDELSKDAGYHWYGCECGEVKERQTHRYTWTQHRAATVDAPGLVQGECSVCGHVVNCRTQLDPEEAERLRAEAEAEAEAAAAAAAAAAATPSPSPAVSADSDEDGKGLMGIIGAIFS